MFTLYIETDDSGVADLMKGTQGRLPAGDEHIRSVSRFHMIPVYKGECLSAALTKWPLFCHATIEMSLHLTQHWRCLLPFIHFACEDFQNWLQLDRSKGTKV